MIRLALLAFLCSTPALADSMGVYIRNDNSHGVAVELTSRNRQMKWPGGEQVWFVDRGERKSVQIECEASETICFGAWVAGDDRQSFGIGPGDDQRCEDCCFACEADKTHRIDIGE